MSASRANSVELLRHETPAPMVESSGRFVESAGIRWFVRCEGRGPVLLLLHGTGSSSSTWRDLIPALATRFTLVAPDLPGHGLSSPAPLGRNGLPEIALATSILMRDLGLAAEFIAGHSAGAAISAQMVLAEATAVRRLAWIAAALTPFNGVAGMVAPPLARLLSRSTLLPHLAAWRARSDTAVRRMIANTGSTLDGVGIQMYSQLLRRPSHVAGALAMMAGWDLGPLNRFLPSIDKPVLLLHGDADRIVPARQSAEIAARLANARVDRLPALGHLMHEEQPQRVAHALASWFGEDTVQ